MLSSTCDLFKNRIRIKLFLSSFVDFLSVHIYHLLRFLQDFCQEHVIRFRNLGRNLPNGDARLNFKKKSSRKCYKRFPVVQGSPLLIHLEWTGNVKKAPLSAGSKNWLLRCDKLPPHTFVDKKRTPLVRFRRYLPSDDLKLVVLDVTKTTVTWLIKLLKNSLLRFLIYGSL